MKSILLFAAVLSLKLCAAPAWYYMLDKQGPSYYVGYGQGSSEADAKEAALADISSQISVTVERSFSSDMGISSGETYKNVQDKSSLRTYAQIEGYRVEKLERQGGQYFIAVSYENIPSIDKFNREIVSLTIDKPEIYNSYLQQTPIAQELKRKVNFTLKRKDGLWYIRYKNIYQVLDERDFSHFFTTTSSPKLTLTSSSPKNLMYEGDSFYFNVDAKEDGFITLFTVYEDGTVAKLMANIPVKKSMQAKIPDKDFESVLQAGLMEEGRETFDLYVAVLTDKREHFDQFAKADEKLISDERYKNFDALIALLENRDYVTLKLVTKPR